MTLVALESTCTLPNYHGTCENGSVLETLKAIGLFKETMSRFHVNFARVFLLVCLCIFVWFSVRGYWKSCRSHKDGTDAEAAVGFLGFFGFVLFVTISKHPPAISSCLAASVPCLTSRTISSGQIMGARQSVRLSGFRASGF